MAIRKHLIVPDTHVPYHDERALSLMLRAAAWWKPWGIYHQGDLVDCYTVSTHSKDPKRVQRWTEERDAGREVRGRLDALKPKKKLITLGNHEFRLARKIAEKVPELDGVFDIDSELQLSENGWEVVGYREDTQIGAVYATHDVGGGGKYTTANALNTYQHSVMIGHHHRIQYLVEGDATGTYRVGAQFGWLGDVEQVDYQHKIKSRRDWSLGFGLGYHDTKSDLMYLVPVPIVEYTCMIEGKVFRG